MITRVQGLPRRVCTTYASSYNWPVSHVRHHKVRDCRYSQVPPLLTGPRYSQIAPLRSSPEGQLPKIQKQALAEQLPKPTPENAISLFQRLQAKFPSGALGDDKWYLVAASALAGSEPNLIANLYTYLISQPAYNTPTSRKALVRRLREALVKDMCILGVCKPIEAIVAISKVERDEDKDYSFSREHWQSGLANHERGMKWFEAIYKQNGDKTLEIFDAHRDLAWISTEISYGLFLSDHSILGPVETELVVLAGIMIQNLPLETAWHLRGMRRVGVSHEDVELVHQCVEMVAKFAMVRIDRVPRVAEIEHEV